MIHVGTSGYSYAEWKGSFYPEDLAASGMLEYYSARLSTVEINNTFYRLPSEKVLKDWAGKTPDAFTLTLKAPRRMTHQARLRNCEDLLEVSCERARTLGLKLGVLLFQLPPYFRKNLDVLDAFVRLLPSDLRVAFEFRHDSWHSDDVLDLFRDRNIALCVTDGEKSKPPAVATAGHAYFRLRDEGYQETDIERWAGTIAEIAATVTDVFVYFKHEEAGKGPEFARLLMDRLERG